jgi:hypothetical protein
MDIRSSFRGCSVLHYAELGKVIAMSLDTEGTIVIAIQIIALILLTIGVYPYRIRTKNRNLIMHGFLGIAALALNLATIFWVMIPGFSSGVGFLGEMSILQAVILLLHAGLGLATVGLGFVIIVSWITRPLGELGCTRTWRMMIPTFAIWATTLVFGLVFYFAIF